MIYTDLTKKALQFCFEAHREQFDKAGMPYVFHPFHLAEQMVDEASIVVALLHDVVEDTDFGLDDLAKLGLSDAMLEAISLLTRDKSNSYMEYIWKISENPIARVVKLADLKHNSNLSRLDVVTDRDISRNKRYLKAIALLEDVELNRSVDGVLKDAAIRSSSYKSFDNISFVKE